MALKQLVYGAATFVPGIKQYYARGTGGTTSARYCYSIWLRHLVMAKKNGLNSNPKIVAELGPGDSLGIGIAALISGCNKYMAFDIIEHANVDRNLKIFEEILTLFKNRTDIPGDDEFPRANPCLERYDFPDDIFDQERMQFALAQERIDKIKDSIRHVNHRDSLIIYKAPWYDSGILERESVDMIYSQAVLEHVDELQNAYRAMQLWLKPKGYISHQIDYKCHGTADEWNGHWKYSDFMWKIIKGKRPYLINRASHSTHIRLLKEEGFKIICDKTISKESNIAINELASRFKSMPEVDLNISGAFIQAVKT